MKRFRVPVSRFFADERRLGIGVLPHLPADARERCREPIRQLVERFGLAGRPVLSIGAGPAFEEYWLAQAGCPLTLVDIDEYGILTPWLERLHDAGAPGDSGDELTYLIGDASAWESDERFGCCYFSGLTPDELRRKEIQAPQRTLRQRLGARLNRLAARIADRRPFDARTWPANASPFGPIVEATLRNRCAEGGLFISQSYAWGVDVIDNPHWVGTLRNSLGALGVQLVALYHLENAPAVTLTVGLKGSPSDAAAFLRQVAARPDLSTFHGRHPSRGRARPVALDDPAGQ